MALSPSGLARVDALFDRLAVVPGDGQAAALAELTVESPELAAELRERLRLRDVAPPEVTAERLREQYATLAVAAAGLEPGDGLLGRYTVTAPPIIGGMAEVYPVREHLFSRLLAMKVIGFEFVGHPEAERRFEAEANLIARLQHPNIVPIHDRGRLDAAHAGRLYYTMELVRGETLHSLLARAAHTPTDRQQLLRVFGEVCGAVGYAHARDVVHRDLKPENIMVGEFGEVQVLDWGIARGPSSDWHVAEEAVSSNPGCDSAFQTRAGAVLGTPAYMAPEQARGEAVDARADVFALGGILCEVLTGTPPHTGETSAEVLRKAALGDTAAALARLRDRGADATLVELTRRCLATRPEDRPANGAEVAAAIQDHGREVARWAEEKRVQEAKRQEAEQRAVAETERAVAEEKKKRFARYLAVSLGVLLLASAAGTVYFDHLAEVNGKLADDYGQLAEKNGKLAETNGRLAKEKNQSLEESTRLLSRSRVRTGIRLAETGDLIGALPWLVEGLRLDERPATDQFADRLRLAAVRWQCPNVAHLSVYDSPVVWVSFHPVGDRVALATQSGQAGVLEVATGHFTPLLGRPSTADRPRSTFWKLPTFSPDGRTLAVLDRSEVALWDAAARERVGSLPWPKADGASHLCFSRDGKWLLTAEASEARVWDVGSRRLVTTWRYPGRFLNQAEFSPDGRHVVITKVAPDSEASAWVWCLADVQVEEAVNAVLSRLPGVPPLRFADWRRKHFAGWTRAAFSYDSQRIAGVDTTDPPEDGKARNRVVLHRLDDLDQKPEIYYPGIPFRINDVSFAPTSGKLLCAGEWDGGVSGGVWQWLLKRGERHPDPDLREGNLLVQVNHPVDNLGFSHDGKRVWTAWKPSHIPSVRVWESFGGRPLTPVVGHGSLSAPPIFSPDGRYLVTAGQDATLRVWDLDVGMVSAPSYPRLAPPALAKVRGVPSPNFQWSVTRSEKGKATLVPFAPSAKPTDLGHDGKVTSAVFSPDSRYLATWTGGDGETTHEVRLWSLGPSDSVKLVSVTKSPEPVTGARFNSQIDRLLFTTWDRVVVTGLASPNVARTIVPIVLDPSFSRSPVLADVEFSPDGRKLLVATNQLKATGVFEGILRVIGVVQVWDLDTGKALSPPLEHGETVAMKGHWSRSGRWLITASEEWGSRPGFVRVWDVDQRAAVGNPISLPGLHDAEFLDEKRAVLFSQGAAQVWDLEARVPTTPLLVHAATPFEARLDQRNVLWTYGPVGNVVGVWDLPSADAILPPERRNPVMTWSFRLDEPAHRAGRGTSGSLERHIGVGSTFRRYWQAAPEHRSLDDLLRMSRVLSGRQINEHGVEVSVEQELLMRDWAATQRSR